jgi:predicted negative regulator of RcsB-dependent stress response
VKRVASALVLATFAIGCAYYNGLYNANHLAKEATKAEREGRTGEARSFWSQAAVKAESVASRHPHSKWRDDALLLQGKALQSIRACAAAIAPLELAADSSPDPKIRVEAALRAGQCRLDTREPDSALAVVAPVLEHGSVADQSEARLVRGEAYLRLGQPERALDELAASAAPGVAFPKAIALTRLGRAEEGAAELRRVVAGPYDEDDWLPALDTVGQAAPAEVSTIVDSLVKRDDIALGQRLRLWLQDGQRWLQAADTARAMDRFLLARKGGPDSTAGRAARTYIGVVAAERAQAWSAVSELYDSLSAAIRQGGEPVRIAGKYMSILTRVRAGLQQDSASLGLFLSAEDVRDSIGNAKLAESLFEQVVERYPETPLAPKALVALALLRPEVGDSLVGVLRERYPASPYTLLLSGSGGAAYEALEDSLRKAAAATGRRRGRQERPPGDEPQDEL